jgi:hypothetical protein
MSACLCINIRKSSAYAVTGQACARTKAYHTHFRPGSEHAKHSLSASNNAASGTCIGSAAHTGTCHSPEFRQLWHTIPISTASPAV